MDIQENVRSTLVRMIHLIYRIFWRVLKPQTLGARAIVENSNHEVLLVRHRYSGQWYLPGGNVQRREFLVDAIRRELFEETGISNLELRGIVGVYSSRQEGKYDHIVVFRAYARQYVSTRSKGKEIQDLSFFDPVRLPNNVSVGTTRRIEEYLGQRQASFEW